MDYVARSSSFCNRPSLLLCRLRVPHYKGRRHLRSMGLTSSPGATYSSLDNLEQGSHFACGNLSLLICTMGTRIIPFSQCCWEDEMKKHMGSALGTVRGCHRRVLYVSTSLGWKRNRWLFASLSSGGPFPIPSHLIQWDSLRPWPMEGQDSERWVLVWVEDLLQAAGLFGAPNMCTRRGRERVMFLLHFPSQLLSLLVADMIKAEVHPEGRPHGPARPFPDVAWGGGCRSNVATWRACACVMENRAGWAGAGARSLVAEGLLFSLGCWEALVFTPPL